MNVKKTCAANPMFMVNVSALSLTLLISSRVDAEQRIAHLRAACWEIETLCGVRHPKPGGFGSKSLGLVELTLSEKRSLISALQQEYCVREICETLGFNRSSFYYGEHTKYQIPQEDPSEDANPANRK